MCGLIIRCHKEINQTRIAVVNDASTLIQLSRDAAWVVERPAATGYYSGAITAGDLAGLAAGTFAFDLDLGNGSQSVTATLAPRRRRWPKSPPSCRRRSAARSRPTGCGRR